MITTKFYIVRRHRQEASGLWQALARLRRHARERLHRGPDDYFLTPSAASASFASATDSACFPSLWSPSALSSMAVAFFTFSSFASIFAAASRPCLISVGHWNASAVPALTASAVITAVAAMSFLMGQSPPSVPSLADRSTAIAPVGVRRPPTTGVLVDSLSELGRHLRHRRELGDRGLADAPRRAERLEQARADRRPDARDRVEDGL